jgi:putative ABC transport system permease protein
MALRSLGSNKMRAALTMLGMVIGVGSVIALMSVGKGSQASILGQIQSMGTNLLFVSPGATQSGGVSQGLGSSASLTMEDAEAIAEKISTVAKVAPEATSFQQVVAGGNNTRTRILGTTPDYQEVRNFKVANGEFVSKANVDGRASVAVLGTSTATTLFGSSDAIGQNVRINGINFRVIGIMESKGSQAMGNQDDVIIVPITTFMQRLSNQRTTTGQRSVNTINVQVVSEKVMSQATADIGSLLRERHRVAADDFTIRSQEDMLSTMATVTQTMTLLLGSIAGISLIVGGIGIMNIMLVSVTERTREIGIRKAIGAKRSDILIQFIIEAMVVSLMGGVIGIILGMGASQLVGRMSLNGQTLKTVVSGDAILLAFGVSAAIGMFFGIYPASRAAALNPIQALRYE